MTTLKWILSLGLGIALSGSVAVAATAKTAARPSAHKAATKKHAGKAAQKNDNADLQTDVKFDESVLHGQYQVPEEALAKVENEKALADLIGVRKHFKDRLATASQQE